MYICEDCGMEFSCAEKHCEPHGETVWLCPGCGSHCFSVAAECKVCGKTHSVYELTEGVCSDCIEAEKAKYKYDFERCMGIADKESMELNSFLLSQFTPAEIEAVLYRELKEANAIKPIDCTSFIESDAGWFEDRIMEELE